MRKFKMILLCSISFCLTGCSVDYKATITDDLRVEESFSLQESIEIYDQGEDVEIILENKIKSMKTVEGYEDFDINSSVGSENFLMTFKNEYESLDSYTKTEGFTSLFEGADIEYTSDYIKLTSTGNKPYTKFKTENMPHDIVNVEGINIEIKFYNNIIESNADSYNKLSNTLVWNFNSLESDKEIYFKIGKGKRYDIIVLDFLLENIFKTITVGLIITIFLAAALYFYSIYRIKDKIY